MYVCTIHVYRYMYLCIDLYICTKIHTYSHARMHACTHTHSHINTHVHIICKLQMNSHIHIHTHTQLQIPCTYLYDRQLFWRKLGKTLLTLLYFGSVRLLCGRRLWRMVLAMPCFIGTQKQPETKAENEMHHSLAMNRQHQRAAK